VHKRCLIVAVAMFRLQGSKVLAVDMTGDAVKAKNGSMVAYDGQMDFKKLSRRR
jgi:hypothetical protein